MPFEEPVLNLTQSNQMAELAAAFCARNASANDPFEPLTVIVQSFGIGQWLKLKLAEHHGVSANVDCVLPATYLWRLYQQIAPEASGHSPFERNRLTWRIMQLLRKNPALSGAINNYLEGPGDADLRCYQLSYEIAGLYDEYLMYRPDWILAWETATEPASGHENWQSELWRLIVADTGNASVLHRARLHERLLEACRSGALAAGLPQRLSVFGLSTMPPLQLETMEALAAHIEVDIYFLNPCQHYWGDIVSEKDIARRSIRSMIDHDGELIDEDYLDIGNPLLSSLGKQGREYLELLLESNLIDSQEHFIEFDEDKSLNIVKNDILNLTFGGEFDTGAVPVRRAMNDHSLQLHSCHSRQREVEVLHDQIQHIIAAQPDISTSDILVMVPDIGDYTPYIHSVFTGSMSFRIADRTALDESNLIASFLTLLSLPESRFTGPEVMDLIEVPAIARRFMLDQEDLERIALWINEARIRWEISGERKSTHWALPDEHHNTWRFGLDRLLLGFAMLSDHGTWQDTLPFDITPSETELLGKLCRIVELLDAYRLRFNTARNAEEWRVLTSELIDDMFEPRNEEVLDTNVILGAMDQLVEDTAAAGFHGALSTRLVHHYLSRSLAEPDSKAGFISGGVTFATLVPMRSIPFRAVCLLGMNDGEYPRDKRPYSFDLMAIKGSRKGDRSRKLDDRYLFLEALMSAQDVFYVSYIGKGIRDNKDRPPSAVVAEWQQYLHAMFENIETLSHPLQPFSPRYFQGDELQSYSSTWYEALTSADSVAPFAEDPLAFDDSLTCTSLMQLEQFFRHSAKYFMQQRLGVYFETDEVELNETEPFDLDNLAAYQLADSALTTLVHDEDLGQWHDAIMASGEVMTGAVGEAQIGRNLERAKNIFDVAAPHLEAAQNPIIDYADIAGVKIYVHLPNVFGQQIVDYRAGRLQDRHLLLAWIRHLAANALGSSLATLCIARGRYNDVEQVTLNPLTAEESHQHLERLLAIYNEGVMRPLFLPPETSRAFTEHYLDSQNTEFALAKAHDKFNREQIGAECFDRYWQRLFYVPEDLTASFQANALSVWQSLLEAKA